MFTSPRFKDLTYSVAWNLMLLTLGSLVFAFGLKTIALPQGFISGGLAGVGLLLHYTLGWMGPGPWYLLINLPVFLLGWLSISRRFFLYSLYGTLVFTLSLSLFRFSVSIQDPLLAALAGGTLMGAGAGIALRSIGSLGGMDIIAIYLNQRFNLRIGQVFFYFNSLLFLVSLFFLDLEPVLYSLAMVFIISMITDYFLSMFNQRKMVLVITDKVEEITSAIQGTVNRGVTLLQSRGAYSGKDREIILTVVDNFQVKRLEELIYTLDPKAFTIFGNTWNVFGTGFSRRKVY